MSFVLPRNAPRLTFSGRERAPRPAGNEAALGRPQPPRSGRDVYAAADAVATPYVGSRPSFTAERAAMASYPDDAATVALHREAFERGAPAAYHRSYLPVFELRHAVDPVARALVLPGARPRKARPLLVVAWLMAAVLMSMAGFRYAPQTLDAVEDAVRALGR